MKPRRCRCGGAEVREWRERKPLGSGPFRPGRSRMTRLPLVRPRDAVALRRRESRSRRRRRRRTSSRRALPAPKSKAAARPRAAPVAPTNSDDVKEGHRGAEGRRSAGREGGLDAAIAKNPRSRRTPITTAASSRTRAVEGGRGEGLTGKALEIQPDPSRRKQINPRRDRHRGQRRRSDRADEEGDREELRRAPRST